MNEQMADAEIFLDSGRMELETGPHATVGKAPEQSQLYHILVL